MTTKKLSILPLFLTVFIDLVGVGIIIPVIAPLMLNPMEKILPFATTLATRSMLLGFLVAAYPLAQFFGAPILGGLADRMGRRKVLLVALTGTVIGYVIFAIGVLQGNLIMLFASRILDGFTGGNISIVQSSIADVSDEKNRSKNFGLIGMAFGLGFILGPYIGGKLADPSIVSWFNSATPFWFAAILTAINIVMVIARFPETIGKKSDKEMGPMTGIHNIMKAFTLPNTRALFTVVFLITVGFSFFTQFFSVYLINKFQFTQSNIGDFFAWVGICVAFVQGGLIRPVSARWNPIQIMTVTLPLLGIALAVLLLPTAAWALLCVIPFVAITYGLTMPSYTNLVSRSAASDSQGEILGINQSVQSLGQAIPPIIAGFIVSIHQYLPIATASTVMFVAWIVFMLFYRKSAKKQHIFESVA